MISEQTELAELKRQIKQSVFKPQLQPPHEPSSSEEPCKCTYSHLDQASPEVVKKKFHTIPTLEKLILAENLGEKGVYGAYREQRANVGIFPATFEDSYIDNYIRIKDALSKSMSLWRKGHRKLQATMFDDHQESSDDDDGCFDGLVFPAHSRAFQAWKAMILLLCIFSSLDYTHQALVPDYSSDWLAIIYSIVFQLDMALSFFTDPDDPKPKKWKQVAGTYLKGWFFADLVAILPLYAILTNWVGLPGEHARLAFLVKDVRLVKGFYLLSSRSYKKQISEMLQRQLNSVSASSRYAATIKPNRILSLTLLFPNLVRILQLSMFLLCISFLSGCLWYIGCQKLSDKQWWWMAGDPDEIHFLEQFELTNRTSHEIALTQTYFAMTTFTTVGLGDLHPVSNSERMMGVILLLGGLMVAAFMTSNFVRIIQNLQCFTWQPGSEQALAFFFKTLSKYNEGEELSYKQPIEEYLRYRWKADKVNVLFEKKGSFGLLPSAIQRKLLEEFLLQDFSELFKRYFQAILLMNKRDFHNRFNRLHRAKSIVVGSYKLKMRMVKEREMEEDLSEFKFNLMSALEPQLLPPKTLVQVQNQVADEVSFIIKGSIDAGYNFQFMMAQQGMESTQVPMQSLKITKAISTLSTFFARTLSLTPDSKFKYPVTITAGQAVGLFENLFLQMHSKDACQLSSFIYKVSADEPCDVLYLRRTNLSRILQKAPASIITNFKRQVLVDYVEKVFLPIQQSQQTSISSEKREGRRRSRILTIPRQKRSENVLNDNSISNLIEAQSENKSCHSCDPEIKLPLRIDPLISVARLDDQIETEFSRKEEDLVKKIRLKDNISDPLMNRILKDTFHHDDHNVKIRVNSVSEVNLAVEKADIAYLTMKTKLKLVFSFISKILVKNNTLRKEEKKIKEKKNKWKKEKAELKKQVKQLQREVRNLKAQVQEPNPLSQDSRVSIVNVEPQCQTHRVTSRHQQLQSESFTNYSMHIHKNSMNSDSSSSDPSSCSNLNPQISFSHRMPSMSSFKIDPQLSRIKEEEGSTKSKDRKMSNLILPAHQEIVHGHRRQSCQDSTQHLLNTSSEKDKKDSTFFKPKLLIPKKQFKSSTERPIPITRQRNMSVPINQTTYNQGAPSSQQVIANNLFDGASAGSIVTFQNNFRKEDSGSWQQQNGNDAISLVDHPEELDESYKKMVTQHKIQVEYESQENSLIQAMVHQSPTTSFYHGGFYNLKLQGWKSSFTVEEVKEEELEKRASIDTDSVHTPIKMETGLERLLEEEKKEGRKDTQYSSQKQPKQKKTPRRGKK